MRVKHLQTREQFVIERLAIAKGYDQAADHWVREGNLSEATVWPNRAAQERRNAKEPTQ